MKKSYQNRSSEGRNSSLLTKRPDDEVQRATTLRKQAADLARQASMDPDDGLGL